MRPVGGALACSGLETGPAAAQNPIPGKGIARLTMGSAGSRAEPWREQFHILELLLPHPKALRTVFYTA